MQLSYFYTGYVLSTLNLNDIYWILRIKIHGPNALSESESKFLVTSGDLDLQQNIMSSSLIPATSCPK